MNFFSVENKSIKIFAICPECQQLAFLNINNDNIIKIDNCINKHRNE